MRLAIIGRPNVGKSSLLNAFLGAERVIVSDVAGTTRDAIDVRIEVDGRPFVLVDTAGIRRQAKVSEAVEYYTTLRSRRAAERADVALVVCDATDGVTAQDLRIAELAMTAGCATALVLNKWDLTGGDEFDLEHERARVAQKLRLRPRVLTASAKTGRNLSRLLAEARRARGPLRRPHPDARAQPLPRRGGPGPPAARQAGQAPEAALRRADRHPAAALLLHRELPHARDARLRLLPREPPARALRHGGDPARDRLQRARSASRTPRAASSLPARAGPRPSSPLVLAVLALSRAVRLRRLGLEPARRERGRSSSPATRWSTCTSRPTAAGTSTSAPARSRRSSRATAACATRSSGAWRPPAARVNFERDIQPWLGKEAALALLNAGSDTAGSLVLFDVARLQGGARVRGPHDRRAGDRDLPRRRAPPRRRRSRAPSSATSSPSARTRP